MSMGITAILANEKKTVITFTNVYRVWENGAIIAEGSTRDIERVTGMGYDMVGKYAKSGNKYKNKYQIEKI